jgi:ribonuclease G
MEKILINIRPNLTRVAYIKNGELEDLRLEKRNIPTLVGSIYKGKVQRVLPGMQASFVDIGLKRSAFLYVGDIQQMDPEEMDEIIEPKEMGEPVEESQHTPIQELISKDDILMVQVAKDPLGTKGARITTHVSIATRHLVFMPLLKDYGVSRKIEDEEKRTQLKSLVESMSPNGGVIVRTAGENADISALQMDLDYAEKLWSQINDKYQKKEDIGLVHSEEDIEIRSLRDLLNENVCEIIVDDPIAYEKISRFLEHFLPLYRDKLKLYQQDQPLFDLFDLDLEISRSLERKVWLKSGGYIVIDEAEALVAIDVNTGSYVGKKDLEETILKTNLEAAKEIAYQIKIRNCGGIIILDFIDMEKTVHKEKLLQVLSDELKMDKARTEIVSMSDLGLVQMTRKRTKPSLISLLSESCSYCSGKGYVKTVSTIANELLRDLEREVGRLPKTEELKVFVHPKVADWLYNEDPMALEFVENKLNKTISFEINKKFHIEEYEISS